MSEKPSLIELIVADPFAGAHRYLRNIDPLYQAEIGIEREWSVRLEVNDHGCNCEYCSTNEVVKIMALTAHEAVSKVELDDQYRGFVTGVRPTGSNGRYADPEELISH